MSKKRRGVRNLFCPVVIVVASRSVEVPDLLISDDRRGDDGEDRERRQAAGYLAKRNALTGGG